MARREGSKGGSGLEHLVESWLQSKGWKTHRAAAVRVGMRSRSCDIFGVFDLIAVGGSERLGDPRPENPTGYTLACQTTVWDGRSARKKKIEAAGPWPTSWRVSVVTHESVRTGRMTVHWFLVEDYFSPSAFGPAGVWTPVQRVRVDMKEILEFRSNKAALERAAAAQAAREAGAK